MSDPHETTLLHAIRPEDTSQRVQPKIVIETSTPTEHQQTPVEPSDEPRSGSSTPRHPTSECNLSRTEFSSIRTRGTFNPRSPRRTARSTCFGESSKSMAAAVAVAAVIMLGLFGYFVVTETYSRFADSAKSLTLVKDDDALSRLIVDSSGTTIAGIVLVIPMYTLFVFYFNRDVVADRTFAPTFIGGKSRPADEYFAFSLMLAGVTGMILWLVPHLVIGPATRIYMQ